MLTRIRMFLKRRKIYIFFLFFFVFMGIGSFLLWRINQPKTVAPEDSEASTFFPPIEQKILLLIYDAHELHPDKRYYDPQEQNTRLINLLEEGSRYHGYKDPTAPKQVNFKVVDTIIYRNVEVPIIPGTGGNSGDGDYNKIIDDNNLCQRFSNGEFDEVWIWAGSVGGLWEATVAGPANRVFDTNGEPVIRNDCNGIMHIMAFNYEAFYDINQPNPWDPVSVGNAMHSFFHRIENTIAHYVDGTNRGSTVDSNWRRFDGKGGYNGTLISNPGCGNIHFAPNSSSINDVYVLNKKDYVQTDCQDWNPQRTGEKESINCSTWGCNQEGYIKWWLQNMPGRCNNMTKINGEPMPNWWWLILKMDKPESSVSCPCELCSSVYKYTYANWSAGSDNLCRTNDDPYSTATYVCNCGCTDGEENAPPNWTEQQYDDCVGSCMCNRCSSSFLYTHAYDYLAGEDNQCFTQDDITWNDEKYYVCDCCTSVSTATKKAPDAQLYDRKTSSGPEGPISYDECIQKCEVSSYTVTLNKYGGSGGTSSVVATLNQPMPSATAPTRSGYTFLGYYTSTSGGTKYYNSNMTSARNWDRTSNTTLYAQWQQQTAPVQTYTVTLNKYGGSGGTSSVVATLNQPMPSATAPTRSGYTFLGYYTSTSGGTKYYNSNMTSARNWDRSINTTLYAQWQQQEPEAEKYTVILYRNGGTGGTSSVVAILNQPMPSAIAPTRSGYIFLGYYTSTVGGTRYYNSNMTSAKNWDISSDTNLYAQWQEEITQEKGYTVTLDKNGGSGGTSSVVATLNQPMPSAIAPTRSGYTFQGYYSSKFWGTQYYNSNMASARNWDKSSNTTLYAHWKRTSSWSWWPW